MSSYLVQPAYPAINRAHPLANGLGMAVVPFEGSGPLNDLASLRSFTPSGTTSWGSEAYGTTRVYDANGDDTLNANALHGWFEQSVAVGFRSIGTQDFSPGETSGRLVEKGSNNEWTMSFSEPSTPSNSVSLFRRTPNIVTDQVNTAGGLNDGIWHHIVGNVGRAGVELYLDGNLSGTDYTAGTLGGARNNALYIGKFGGGGFRGRFILGYLYIYNRWLSESDAAQIAHDPFALVRPKRSLVSMYVPPVVGGGVSGAVMRRRYMMGAAA
jgi:hypothetical protein